MVQTAADIQKGMGVYSSNGDKLGEVHHVWPYVTDAPTHVTASGYFSVREGGTLGIGGKDLYVPFAAVDDITRGDCLTLSCTKEEANRLYASSPDALAAEPA
jgi:hypothetical protein